MKGDCIECGLCKRNCPIYKVMLKETQSPRARAAFIKDNKIEGSVFYSCTLCESYNEECPAGVCLEIEQVRKELVQRGVGTKANKQIAENLRKYGNPFGPEQI